jgi:hypothetical protein
MIEMAEIKAAVAGVWVPCNAVLLLTILGLLRLALVGGKAV